MSVFSTIVTGTVSCFLSTFFIIQITLPIFEQTRITIQAGLIATILTAILNLCGAQCIMIGIRQGIDDILILFICQACQELMTIAYAGRKSFVYFYFLPPAITALFLPQTRPLSTRTGKRRWKKRCKGGKRSVEVEDAEEEKLLSLVLPATTPSPQPLAGKKSVAVEDAVEEKSLSLVLPATTPSQKPLAGKKSVAVEDAGEENPLSLVLPATTPSQEPLAGKKSVAVEDTEEEKPLSLVLPATTPFPQPLAGKKSVAVEDAEEENPLSLVLPMTSPSPQPLATAVPSLIVYDTILGYGSNKTVVYEGSFQGRAVAVKCYRQDYISLATREVSILQQSDDHPNVVRYFYQESHPKFFYIALDLCPGSLADIIENLEGDVWDKRREQWKDIARDFDERKAMKQIASGLRYLHGLGLVHRDIKPQNILISSSSSSRGRYRMLISDFGLCKRLDVDQSSLLPTMYGFIAAGTAGWRAPEMLQCWNDKLESLDTISSLVTAIKGSSSGTTTTCQCLTKSVDIFALGCLFYYILTKGRHPYGNRFDRGANIIKEIKDLSLIYSNEEAHDLITHMLHQQPSQRPDIETCLLHPFFWDPAKRLEFLGNASDRFEIMCKDPMDSVLIRLERDARSIIKTDWHQTLDESVDQILIKNLRQSRKYDGNSVRDLLRVLRNKKSHYQDLPYDIKLQLGSMPEGFLEYFTCRYPRLLVHVHEVIRDTGLYRDSIFTTYFELPEG